MFQNEFNVFNLDFQSPPSNICSLWEKLACQIKTMTDARKKVENITQKRVHKLDQIYKLIKNKVDNSFILCFYLQKIQHLPKCTIQEAY